MIFCFTISLNETRIALLSSRLWKFYGKFFVAWTCHFSEIHPLVFHYEFHSSQFISLLEKFCNQPGDCVFAMRYEMQILPQAGFLELSRNLLHVSQSFVRSSLGALIFFFLDSDTSCAPDWFHGQVPILLSIVDETFANSLEIPCERMMISKFVLSNGQRCCATRKTTSELNVVSSCCRIVLFF